MNVKFHCPKSGISDSLLSETLREVNAFAGQYGLHIGTLKMSIGLKDTDGHTQNVTCEVPNPDWDGDTTEANVGFLIRTEPYKKLPKGKTFEKVLTDENGEVIGYMYRMSEISKYRYW